VQVNLSQAMGREAEDQRRGKREDSGILEDTHVNCGSEGEAKRELRSG